MTKEGKFRVLTLRDGQKGKYFHKLNRTEKWHYQEPHPGLLT